MKEQNDIFKEITDSILKFERGDVLLLSEIADNFDSLSTFFKEDSVITEFINFLKNILVDEIRGANVENITSILSEGIDILQVFEVKKNLGDESSLYEKVKDVKSLYTPMNKNSDKNSCETENDESEKNDKSIINSDIIKTFIVEAEEKTIRAQEIILELENDPENSENINELFRIFHTIKGECGFLKIASLGELTHNLESLLALLRDKKILIDSEIIDILLEGTDYSKKIVSDLKKGNGVIFNKINLNNFIESISNVTSEHRVSVGEVLVMNNKLTPKDVENILCDQKLDVFTKKFGEIAVENSYISKKDIEESLKEQAKKKITDEKGEISLKTDPIVKVKASRINYLVDMIGELLIAEGQISASSPIFNQIRKISRSIQYAAMQLRTEKAKNLFSNMRRIARDVSKKLNKPIVLETLGEDLEVDRNLIENLEEPLMHLIRNSIHHGIEEESVRIKNNKSPEGKITIEAERRGNNIVVSVMDDGAGLNKEKILKKALEKKIIKNENIETLNDNEIFNLIFIQGFSTAETVDLVSGRGVGMDIVNSVVTSLRGRIEIKTKPGDFTKFSLIFPLNTAVIDGMLVRIENDIFIIPVTSIINSIKIQKNNIHLINN
nr:ATP-binding protein [Spirochaetota bacterium]